MELVQAATHHVTGLGFLSGVLLLLVFVLTVLYHADSKVRFYVRAGAFFLLGLHGCFVAAALSLFRPKDARNAMFFSWYGRFVIAKLFNITCDIKGLEHLKNMKSCVIVANHQSALDVFGMMFLWPYINPAVPVMKKQLAWAGPVGLLAYLCSCVFVDRGRSEKAKAMLNKKMEEVKEKKWKIWVFPEGTRNANNDMLLPFKKGAFHIAVQAQIPIVPIVYAPYSHIYDLKHKKFNPGTMKIRVLPPVPTAGLTVDNIPILVEQVRNAMVECYLNDVNNIRSLSNGTSKTVEENGHMAVSSHSEQETNLPNDTKNVIKESNENGVKHIVPEASSEVTSS